MAINPQQLNKQNKKHAALYANSIWLFGCNAVSSNTFDTALNLCAEMLNKKVARMAPRRHKRDQETLKHGLQGFMEAEAIHEMLDFIEELEEDDAT